MLVLLIRFVNKAAQLSEPFPGSEVDFGIWSFSVVQRFHRK